MNSPYVTIRLIQAYVQEVCRRLTKGQTVHCPAANVGPVIELVYRDSKKEEEMKQGRATNGQKQKYSEICGSRGETKQLQQLCGTEERQHLPAVCPNALPRLVIGRAALCLPGQQRSAEDIHLPSQWLG